MLAQPLPQSWEWAKLGDMAEFINGFAFKPSDWGNDGLPIIRIQNLTGSQDAFNKTTKKPPDKYLVRSGDLLVSWSASLGVYVWEGGEALLNQHIFRAIPRAETDKEYLYYAIHHVLDLLKAKTHGSTMLHIKKGDFENTVVPHPPIAEQRRIVDILKRTDGIRRLRKQAIQTTRELIPALFVNVFGNPATNPKGWPIVPLGDVLAGIDSGWSPKCEDRPAGDGEWGILKLGAVTTCQYLGEKNKALPESLDPKPELEVKLGDLLFSRKNTINLVGASVFVESTRPRLLLPDLIFRLRLKTDALIEPEFLWGLLTNRAMRKSIMRLASGSAGSMPNISKERLRTLQVLIPPLSFQRRYTNALRNLKGITAMHVSSDKAVELTFSVLLHRAFRGEL
jgi:type I restriction enzyme, S subunit